MDPRAQTRPSDMLVAFFAPAVAFLALAAGVAVAAVATGADELRWLALHLALLGGVSQLVLGAAQFFVCAFAILALAGWIGLTVLGSLLHLLGVMARVRALGRPPQPVVLRPRHVAVPLVAILAVDALVAARVLGDTPTAIGAGAVLAAVYAGLGARVVATAVRAAPVRI